MPYIIAVLVVVALGVGFTLFQKNNIEAPTAVQVTQEAPARTTETKVENSDTKSDYKDGIFTTDVTYLTPARNEYGVNVALTLKQDIITDVKVTYSNGAEKDPNAAKFEAAYKVQVIGKDIDTLELARVGGASLTTGAFNNALAQIKTKAKS